MPTLSRAAFDACLDFAATGGYALRAYDQWQRLKQIAPTVAGQLRDPRGRARIRMNIGTIIDYQTVKVRMKGRGGAPLGEVEEAFAASLSPGDTFLIGGRDRALRGCARWWSRSAATAAASRRSPSSWARRFATSTQLVGPGPDDAPIRTTGPCPATPPIGWPPARGVAPARTGAVADRELPAR
jgi:ATP-dependent Lhr-like helicase